MSGEFICRGVDYSGALVLVHSGQRRRSYDRVFENLANGWETFHRASGERQLSEAAAGWIRSSLGKVAGVVMEYLETESALSQILTYMAEPGHVDQLFLVRPEPRKGLQTLVGRQYRPATTPFGDVRRGAIFVLVPDLNIESVKVTVLDVVPVAP